MLIPFSPTLITDWSLWNNFKPLKNNFLFQTLAASFTFKFSFNLSPVLLSGLRIQGGSIPLFTLIPSQIIKSYSHFSTKRLVYLSQLVDVDGTYIQSYPELIFSKIVPHAGIYPNWYKDLLTVVCVNPTTRQLHHQYQVPTPLTPNLPLTLVNFQRPAARTWVAHWNTSTNSILFGWIVKNSVSKFTAMLDHWIPDPVNTTALTPANSMLKLTRCPGLPSPSATAKPPFYSKEATCLL